MSDIEKDEKLSPFIIFIRWFHEHVTTTKDSYTGACVLSTIGRNGFPNARTVSLKLLEYPFLIFGTSYQSEKSLEIENNPKVALTFWWEESMRQVRVQGIAEKVDQETADFLFESRKKEAQLTSLISEQSKDLNSLEQLQKKFKLKLEELKNDPIERPAHWGGFKVEPIRFEFLEFKENRLHHRTVYTRTDDGWEVGMLQP